MDNLISAVRLLGPRDNSEEARMNRERFDSFRVIKRGTTDSHEPEYEADYIDFHTHDYYEFVLLHGGQCRFLVGDTFHDLKPRTLLMFDGNMIHKAYPYGDINSYERSLLHFRKDWLKPLLNGLEIEGLLDTFEINKNGFRHSGTELADVLTLVLEAKRKLERNVAIQGVLEQFALGRM